MKKSNLKLSTTSKFVRKVLSRTSNISHEEITNTQSKSSCTSKTMKKVHDSKSLETELESLKEQLSILQTTVNSMQGDVETKEKVLANLAREKQQLATDLRREKRSTTNLQQQLDDERQFYYKEKEQYCKEMNKCKKLKRKLKEDKKKTKNDYNQEKTETTLLEYKDQVTKLREALSQTLETNYNLSVKFLRMKNTKSDLKMRLKKQESEHEQTMQALQTKINNIKNDISDVVDKRFLLPISPSNKKYLQIIKQNGALVHENLCLQMEVNRLNAEMEQLKTSKHNMAQRKTSRETKEKDTTQITEISEEKLDIQAADKLKLTNKSSKKSEKNTNVKHNEFEQKSQEDKKVIKIFERKKSEGIPEIVMLPSSHLEKEVSSVKEDISKVNICTKEGNRVQTEETSEICTEISSSYDAIRTQSAPEIVQTSFFVNEHKLQ